MRLPFLVLLTIHAPFNLNDADARPVLLSVAYDNENLPIFVCRFIFGGYVGIAACSP